MAAERLQKILARGGIASRRAAESLITAGRVRVNGRVITELGSKADFRLDRIEVDGKRIVAETPVYYVMNKPRGYVTTLYDPEGRPTVADLLKPFRLKARLFPVGRLDFNTSGVLLLTNDGEFSDSMLHPRKTVPKTYIVKVQGLMQPKDIERWRAGVTLDDGKTLPAEASFVRFEGDKTWFEITIREGRKNQIRRMGEATNFHVMRLSRTSFAGISVEGLKPGELRMLTYEELVALKKEYGVPRQPSVAKGSAADSSRKRPAPNPRRGPGRKAAAGTPTKKSAISPPRDASGTGTWSRDTQERDRPQSARARHMFEREDNHVEPPHRHREGGFRGHGPDDRNPRDVPRMSKARRGAGRGRKV